MTLSVAGVVVPPVAGADRSPGLQPRPRRRRTGAVRPQPRRQQRLPESRRRLGRRLPRGVHDRRPRTAARGQILTNRLTFNGRSGDGTFITTPSHLSRPRTGRLRRDLLDLPPRGLEGRTGIRAATSSRRAPSRSSNRRCRKAKSRSTARASPTNRRSKSTPASRRPTRRRERSPTSRSPTSPAAPTRESSQTRRAEVTLPAGMGINPSAGNGLVACTDEQFGKGTKNPVACPPASKVGTVSIETSAAARAGSLTGDVYVGQPKSSDPASGDLYRLFVVAGSDRYGISARLVGNVKADPQTGRLTTVFDDAKLGRAALPGLPQVPFTSFKLDFNDGPRAPLTSPPTCGPHTTTTSLTPWTGNPAATPSGDFRLDAAPGGGACAEIDGGAPVRARLQSRDRQSRRAAPSARSAPHHPGRRRAGAERRDGRPAAGPDREAGRPQVLPGVGSRRGRGQQRPQRGRRLQLPQLELRRHRHRPHRQRRAAPDRRQGLPRRPLRRGAPVPGGDHPGDGRAVRSRRRSCCGWR